MNSQSNKSAVQQKSKKLPSQLSKYGIKLKKYLKIRNLVALFCFIGLIVQLIQLAEQYLRFETNLVTELQHKYEKSIESPAFTLCLDKVFDYRQLRNDFNDFDNKLWKSNDKKRVWINPIFRFKNVYEFLVDNSNEGYNLSLVHLLENYSVDIRKMFYFCEFTDCEIEVKKGIEINDKNQIQSFNEFNTYCLTVFALNETNERPFLRTLMSGSNEYQFFIFFNTTKTNISYDIFMAFHSPEVIPRFPNSFFQLKPKTHFAVKYSTNEWILLESPYSTDCHKYSETKKYSSNYDCYSKCEMQEIRKICDTCLPSPETYPYRIDLVDDQDTVCIDGNETCYSEDFNFRDDINEKMEVIEPKCRMKCKIQCERTEIETTVFESKNQYLISKEMSIVYISYNRKNRITHKYTSSLNLANFIANIGGIGGFWFGLSVLAVFDTTILILKYLSHKLFNK